MHLKNRTSLKNTFFTKIIISIISIPIISCAMGVPEKGYDSLTPPLITNCRQDGNNIIVEFRGYNDEYYFDGYNVYISETSMKREDVASYNAVELVNYASTVPSFPMSPDDYDPNLLREVTLYHYYWKLVDTGEYLKYPFSTGTYYIIICSHHRFAGVNDDGVSNQITFDFVE